MEREQILETLKSCKQFLNDKFHIQRVGLFGSYAVYAQTPSSDIDIIYELEEGQNMGFQELYELEIYLRNILKFERIDLINRKYMNPIIEHEISHSVVYV